MFNPLSDTLCFFNIGYIFFCSLMRKSICHCIVYYEAGVVENLWLHDNAIFHYSTGVFVVVVVVIS